MSIAITPEEFAQTTRRDLGLPYEMEPVISYKIRESIFRWIISLLESFPNNNQNSLSDTEIATIPSPSQISVSLIQPNQHNDLVATLWKKAKPTTLDECSIMPHLLLPIEKNTNSKVWL
jgi:hypothetical protein